MPTAENQASSPPPGASAGREEPVVTTGTRTYRYGNVNGSSRWYEQDGAMRCAVRPEIASLCLALHSARSALAAANDDVGRLTRNAFDITERWQAAEAELEQSRSALAAERAAGEDARQLLDAIRWHCKVVYFPDALSYPYEHTMLAQKDMWEPLVAKLRERIAARALAGDRETRCVCGHPRDMHEDSGRGMCALAVPDCNCNAFAAADRDA